jgi:hypothetical protein
MREEKSILYIGEHFCRVPECPERSHLEQSTHKCYAPTNHSTTLRHHATLHGLVVARAARPGGLNMSEKIGVIGK